MVDRSHSLERASISDRLHHQTRNELAAISIRSRCRRGRVVSRGGRGRAPWAVFVADRKSVGPAIEPATVKAKPKVWVLSRCETEE